MYFECPYWQYDACAYNFSTRKISDLRYFPFHTNMLHDIYFCGSDTNNLRCVFLVSEDNGSVTCIKAAKVTDDSTWTITSSVELEKGANKKIEYIDEDNSYCYFSITYLPSVSGLKQYFRISYVTGIIEEMVHSYKSTGKFIGIANGKPYFAKYNDTQLESIYYLNNNKWYALPIDGLKKMIPAYMYLKIKPLGRQNKLYFVISATKMLEPYEPLYQVDYYVIEYTESIAK